MRYFVTFVLPDEAVAKLKLSFAAANFSRNLIRGGCFDKVFSLMPANVRGELDETSEEGYEVLYSKWRRKGGLRGKLAILAEQWKVFGKIGKGDSVWFYNLNFLNGYLFMLLKLFKPRVKRNVIVLDFTPATSRKEQNHWFLKLINSSDGTICLAPSPLFTVKNSALLPGVVPDDGKRWPGVKEPVKEFLISGVLHDNIAMLPTLLEVFSQLPELTLNITGTAPDSTLVESYTSRCPNIHYHGMVSYEEYLEILHRCPFQLSTRNPEAPENQCNFPSKIIEALLHNRIIVSTIHYPQLNGIRYFEVAPDVAGMTADLRRIASLPVADLLAAANQAEEVHKRFSTAVWRSTMERIEAAAK